MSLTELDRRIISIKFLIFVMRYERVSMDTDMEAEGKSRRRRKNLVGEKFLNASVV